MQSYGYRGRSASDSCSLVKSLGKADLVRDHYGYVWLHKRPQKMMTRRRTPAWCLELAHIEQAERVGADGVWIQPQDGSPEVAVTMRDFRRYSFPFVGYGVVQRGLELPHWTSPEEARHQLSQPHRDAPAETAPETSTDGHQPSFLGFGDSDPTAGASGGRKASRRGRRAPVGISPVYAAAWRAGLEQEVRQ